MPERLNLSKNMFSPRDLGKTDYISLNIYDSAAFTRGTSRSLWRVIIFQTLCPVSHVTMISF